MEDRQIIDLYWARSQQAIAESANKYGAYCRTISMNVLGQPEDAEECVSDTWLHAWNVIPPQRPVVLQAFFGKLVRNLSLDRWRRTHAVKRGSGQVELALDELEGALPTNDTVDDALQAQETAQAISRFLYTIPQQDRLLFIRRYWYLDSIQTLAKHASMTQGQVKSRLYRIRQQLRSALEKEGISV